jgi:predicted RNA binding protein YcfA (HicA-like mRNA interferase family)
MRDMVKRAEGVGFYFVRLTAKSHALMRHPNGGQITISSTCSDKKAELAFAAELKRIVERRAA